MQSGHRRTLLQSYGSTVYAVCCTRWPDRSHDLVRTKRIRSRRVQQASIARVLYTVHNRCLPMVAIGLGELSLQLRAFLRPRLRRRCDRSRRSIAGTCSAQRSASARRMVSRRLRTSVWRGGEEGLRGSAYNRVVRKSRRSRASIRWRRRRGCQRGVSSVRLLVSPHEWWRPSSDNLKGNALIVSCLARTLHA